MTTYLGGISFPLAKEWAGAAPASENFPRWALANDSAPTKGSVYAHRIHLSASAYTAVTLMKGATGGTGLVNCFVALFSLDGATQYAVSADVSATIGTTASVAVAPALTVTPPAEGDYYLAILIGNSTTTPPSFLRASTVSNNLWNLAPALTQIHGTTALDAMPATLTLGAVGLLWWARMS